LLFLTYAQTTKAPSCEGACCVFKRSLLFEEDCFVTHYEDVEYYDGQYIGYITANPFGEFNTVTSISFFNEVIPTPTITAGAECQVNQAAQREQVVTYDEIFKVKNAGAFAQGLEAAPYVEA